MKRYPTWIPALVVFLAAGMARATLAQTPPPGDPWPRPIALSNGTALIYQPQVSAWDGNQIQMRAAVAVTPAGGAQTFGSIFATATTQVDRAARIVMFSNLSITKSNFPALADKGAATGADLQAKFASSTRTISLDRVEASLKVAGVKPPTFPVRNDPPRVIVSNTPAILVPIGGAPVVKPLPDDSRFKRVINTQALILQAGLRDDYYLRVYDGWLSSSAIDGPWTQPFRVPFGMDDVAKKLAASGVVDLLDGGRNANPKPSLANGVPAIYTSQVPTELVVFKGQPNFVPIPGTQLLWASNTRANVIIETTTNYYYLMLAGRWFRSGALTGPWSFVASNALPDDFGRIPTSSPAGVVLASVAGTPQAQEAVIANSVPQTATVPRVNGPAFVPNFDGAPQFQPIAGTPLAYTPNAAVPVIQVDPNTYYAVNAGVWFTAPRVTGPWTVATSVPAAIYGIPASSPLHYVTYVRVYGSTPEVVYVGYTPGYMGTVVEPGGTVVYGTGYAYTPWVGSVWYPPPYTYGVAAVPVYNPAVGFSFGFAVGLASAAWATPYYGAAYHGYPCCGSASASVYGQYGNKTYAGTRTVYSTSSGTVGSTASGSYRNNATGTTGTYSGGRSYNPYTGEATRSGSVTGTNTKGGTGSASASQSYNAYTGQKTESSNVSATSAAGNTVDRTGSTTSGPQGYGHSSSTTVTDGATGQSKTVSRSTPPANDHYADASGNVYKGSSSSGWQQHSPSSGGWDKPSGDTSAMDRESEARSRGADRFSGFSRGGGGRSFGGRR